MKKLLFSLCTFGLILFLPITVEAATLTFDPTSVETTSGSTFDVDIIIDTDGAQVTGVDALFEYDASTLEVTGITNGTFLEVGHKDFAKAGQVYVVGLVTSPGESVTGEGVLATVSFKAVGGGTSELTYVCEVGETGESNILEFSTDAPDLIECGQNGKAVVVIDGGTSGGSTGTTGGTTGTSGSSSGSGGSSSSELPKSGVFEDLLVFVIAGGVLFVVGFGARMFI